MNICLQYDKNGRELYYDISSGKKVRKEGKDCQVKSRQ